MVDLAVEGSKTSLNEEVERKIIGESLPIVISSSSRKGGMRNIHKFNVICANMQIYRCLLL